VGLLIGYGGIYIVSDAHAVVEVVVTVGPRFPSLYLPSTGQSHRASVPARAAEWTDRHA